MPSYGPWIGPTEHTETIRIGPDVPFGVDVEGDVRSGIVINNGRVFRQNITRGQTVGSIPSIDASKDCWLELVGEEPLEDGGFVGNVTAQVEHTGDHTYFLVGDYWYQVDSWQVFSSYWDIYQSSNVTPPELPPGAIDVQWEGGVRQPPTLLELGTESLGGGIDQFGFRYAAQGRLPLPFGVGETHNQLMHDGLPGWPGSGGGHTWTPEELAHIQSLLTPLSAGRPPRNDRRWPVVLLGWAGGYPGEDPVPALAHGPYDLAYTFSPEIRLTVRFLRQRHRFVYDSVPIRQTTHRDDHLAGGAYQTWPAPTSRQMSNTTFDGYL